VVGVALLAAGCGADSDPQAAAVEAIAPEGGGVLRLGVVGPVVVDPLAASVGDPLHTLVADAAFDGLTEVDPGTGEVRPSLASSWSSDDGVTWTFELDPERTFADGTPVTAADVVASLERAARAEGDAALSAVQLEGIEGVADLRMGAVEHAGGLEATSEQVVTVRLTAADRELPAILADVTFGVVPESAIAAAAAGSDGGVGFAVGSGPLGRIGRDDEVVTLDPAGERPPDGLDGVVVRSYATGEAAHEAFERGEVDVVAAGADDGESDRRTRVPVGVAYLGANVGSARLADAGQRATVLGSVERSALAGAVGGEVAGRLAPASTPGSDLCAASCPLPAVEDSGAALGAVAAAGPLWLLVGPGDAFAAVADELIARWGEAGLVVERVGGTEAELQAALGGGEYDLVLWGTAGLTPSPTAFLAASFATGGDENVVGLGSVEVDAALATARSTADDAERANAFGAVDRAVVQAGAAVPLVRLGPAVLVAERVAISSPPEGVPGPVLLDVRRTTITR